MVTLDTVSRLKLISTASITADRRLGDGHTERLPMTMWRCTRYRHIRDRGARRTERRFRAGRTVFGRRRHVRRAHAYATREPSIGVAPLSARGGQRSWR